MRARCFFSGVDANKNFLITAQAAAKSCHYLDHLTQQAGPAIRDERRRTQIKDESNIRTRGSQTGRASLFFFSLPRLNFVPTNKKIPTRPRVRTYRTPDSDFEGGLASRVQTCRLLSFFFFFRFKQALISRPGFSKRRKRCFRFKQPRRRVQAARRARALWPAGKIAAGSLLSTTTGEMQAAAARRGAGWLVSTALRGATLNDKKCARGARRDRRMGRFGTRRRRTVTVVNCDSQNDSPHAKNRTFGRIKLHRRELRAIQRWPTSAILEKTPYCYF